MNPTSEVYLMDCMEGLAKMADKSIDLAIIDPPYGIGQGDKKIVSKTVKKDGTPIIKYDRRNGNRIVVKPKMYSGSYNDSAPPEEAFFKELLRVSKNQIIWGANHFISRIPVDSSCWIVWNKVNGDTDQADCELAWTSFDTAVRCFDFMWNGFKQGSFKNGRVSQGNRKLCEARLHPNQKPVALYEWILKNYAKPGDNILDTHMGSQSSRIAAYKMGFDFVGYEIDEHYFNEGNKRFKESIAMPLLDAIQQPTQIALQL